jgi:hypothetical protein
MISMAIGYEPAKAYHVYTALFYCVGIVGVYLLVRIGMLWTDSLLAGAVVSPGHRPQPAIRGRARRYGVNQPSGAGGGASSIGSWRLARGRPERTCCVHRRGRGLVYFQRPGKFVFQLLSSENRTACSGTRLGVRFGGYHLLAVVLEPAFAAVGLG